MIKLQLKKKKKLLCRRDHSLGNLIILCSEIKKLTEIKNLWTNIYMDLIGQIL